MVPLIPKADGGRRPIGLLAGLVRILERIRKPIVASWRASVERPYNWAARGRSPQAASRPSGNRGRERAGIAGGVAGFNESI